MDSSLELRGIDWDLHRNTSQPGGADRNVCPTVAASRTPLGLLLLMLFRQLRGVGREF
jgi:hypothetical protein